MCHSLADVIRAETDELDGWQGSGACSEAVYNLAQASEASLSTVQCILKVKELSKWKSTELSCIRFAKSSLSAAQVYRYAQ
jgi:hypothetical protein